MVGVELKVERIRARVKQFELAARLRVPPTTLCAVENGRQPVTDDFLKRALDEIQKIKVERQQFSA